MDYYTNRHFINVDFFLYYSLSLLYECHSNLRFFVTTFLLIVYANNIQLNDLYFDRQQWKLLPSHLTTVYLSCSFYIFISIRHRIVSSLRWIVYNFTRQLCNYSRFYDENSSEFSKKIREIIILQHSWCRFLWADHSFFFKSLFNTQHT